MRRSLDPERLRRVLEALGRACCGLGTAYLTGGATALLEGWRDTTIDLALVGRFGPLEVRHYDVRAQALAELCPLATGATR